MTVMREERKRFSVAQVNAGDLVISLLVALMALGVVAGIARLFAGLGASTALSDRYPWGIWIGFDFVLIAFSGAGFTMAAVVHVFHQERFHPALRPALLAGLLGYVAVLVILLLDLGRFDRFYHFIIFWNVHSPLFEICWCVLLYTTVLAVEVSPLLFERLGWERLRQWVNRAILPVAILGVTLSSLHQSTLGTLYLNMPHRLNALWYTSLLPLLFFVSSVMAGLSLAMLAYAVAGRVRRQAAQPAVLNGLARGVGWITVLYLALKLGDILLAGEASALFTLESTSLLMGAELVLGAALPALLFLVPSWRARRANVLGGALLILAGVLMNRFNATWFAQTPPAGTASYTPHIMEWLTTLGILAGAALAWYLGVRLLDVFEQRAHE